MWHNKNSNSVKVKALNLRLFSVLCNNKEANNAQTLLNPKYNCGGETFWESDCTTEQDFGIFKENKPVQSQILKHENCADGLAYFSDIFNTFNDHDTPRKKHVTCFSVTDKFEGKKTRTS